MIRSKLASVSKFLEAHPFSPLAQAQVATLCHEIRKANLYEAKGAQLKVRLKWLKVGDRVSKEFFK